MESNDNIPADEMAYARRARPQEKPKMTNELFASLTPSEKRVAIARDVLEWLSEGRLKAKSGMYIAVYETPAMEPGESLRSVDIEDINRYSCQACALGSVFALASFRCGLSIGAAARAEVPINEAIHEQLRDIFDARQLAQIECAFEASPGFDYEVLSRDEAQAAAQFGRRVAVPICTLRDAAAYQASRDARVMRAIMQNIIDNDGTFVP